MYCKDRFPSPYPSLLTIHESKLCKAMILRTALSRFYCIYSTFYFYRLSDSHHNLSNSIHAFHSQVTSSLRLALPTQIMGSWWTSPASPAIDTSSLWTTWTPWRKSRSSSLPSSARLRPPVSFKKTPRVKNREKPEMRWERGRENDVKSQTERCRRSETYARHLWDDVCWRTEEKRDCRNWGVTRANVDYFEFKIWKDELTEPLLSFSLSVCFDEW